jgi:hypothetical protein
MFKFKYAKLEDIPEAQRSFYSQGADGAYYLQVEGAVDRTRLDEFRTNNISLQQQLEAFKGVDPAKISELLENQRKIDEKKLIDAGDIDGVVAQRVATMKQEYEGQIQGLNTKYATANRQLETLLIDNEVRAHAIKIGIAPTAVDDVLLRAKTVFSVENGQPVAKDAKGNLVYGRDGQHSLGIGDWISTLKESAPHLFQPSQGSGSRTIGSGVGADGSKLSASGKIAAGLSNGSSAILS